MPYKKIGFCKVPRSMYIPQYSRDILDAFGAKFDVTVAECIKSLGRENIFLKNFFFERLLTIKHATLDGDEVLRTKVIVVLADFLNSVGYIETSPSYIDYYIDPVMNADELIDRMLGARMPVFKAADLAGEYATIDTLTMFFAEVIRRNAIILNERALMATRLREWIGSIGFKVLHGVELSQMERSMYVIYSSTKKRTKGYIDGMAQTPIPAVENKEVLVGEVGALASAVSIAGPCTNHFKLVSNAILEQLMYWYGPHTSELTASVGYQRQYGPFIMFEMTPSDTVPWMLESQITGLSSTASNFTVKPSNTPPFTLRVPIQIAYTNENGMVASYPDIPEFRLLLTNQKDISKFEWDYFSKWRGRRINSRLDGGTMDFALADAAVSTKVAGGTQIEANRVDGFGIVWLSQAAQNKVDKKGSAITEQYILPSDDGLRLISIDMTAYYARMGNIEALPAFSEFLQLPMTWFMQPADRVVDFVSSVTGLTIEERVRYTVAIAICHNCARYERLTRTPAPINKMQIIRSLLNMKDRSKV